MPKDLAFLYGSRVLSRRLPLIALLALSACRQQDNEKLNESVKELKKTVAALSNQTGALAGEEVEKILNYEYKVEDLKADASRGELEKSLNELGKDRWECFQLEKQPDRYRVFCRRKPKSYLRLIPRLVP